MLRLILLLYTLLAFGYSLLMPMWEAPDETAHYLFVLTLAREDRPPALEDTYEAIQPPLYYWAASLVFRLLDAIDPTLIDPYRPPLSSLEALTRYDWTAENYRFLWGAQLLRWLNIPVGGLALYFIYRGTALLLTKDQRPRTEGDTSLVLGPWSSVIPTATVALIGLMPQYLHNSAAVSNDPLANLAGAILFYGLGRVLAADRRWSPFEVIVLAAAAITFTAAVKLTVLPMSLTLLMALLWRSAAGRRRSLLLGGLLLAGVALTAIALLAPVTAEYMARTFWWRVTFVRDNFSLRFSLWWILTFYTASYWGQVAWEEVRLPHAILSLLVSLSALGWLASLRLLLGSISLARFWRWLAVAAGALLIVALVISRLYPWWRIPLAAAVAYAAILALAWWRQRQADPARVLPVPVWGWRFVWLAAALTLVGVFRNFLATPQYQGRFFFPSLGPLSLLTVTGWYALLPERAAGWLPAIILILLLGLNLLLWYIRIIPVYYQPLLG